MITRNFILKPEANPALEFGLLNRQEIISQLRRQKGLSDQITRIVPDRPEPKVSSRWKGRYYVSSR